MSRPEFETKPARFRKSASSALPVKDRRFVDHLQATAGNRAVAQLLQSGGSHGPVLQLLGKAGPFSQATAPVVAIQRATNIVDKDWKDNYDGTIAYESGDNSANSGEVAITDTIQAGFTEKDLNHFMTGHTVNQFSFDEGNMTRTPRSGFWGAKERVANIEVRAKKLLSAIGSDIEEALGTQSTYNSRSLKHEDWKYVVTVTTKPDTTGATDVDGNYTAGTARLTQFYPLGGPDYLFADVDDLRKAKSLLKK
jgi:hypothetical protein